jgi:hypothetical protein
MYRADQSLETGRPTRKGHPMFAHLLTEGLRKENRLLFGMSMVAGIILLLLILHYVFGFFPTVSYRTG